MEISNGCFMDELTKHYSPTFIFMVQTEAYALIATKAPIIIFIVVFLKRTKGKKPRGSN